MGVKSTPEQLAKKADTESATVRQVGRAYRAGQLSLRAIAAKYETSTGSIRRWAKKYGWKRDLKKDARIEAERRSMVGDAKNLAGKAVNEMSDEEIIDAFADEGAAVLKTHRKQIQALREYGMRLVGDLGQNRTKMLALLDSMSKAGDDAAVTQNPKKSQRKKGKEKDLETEAKKTGDSYLLTSAYREAVGVQAGIFRDLTMAMSKVIPLEREAFGLNTKGEADSESFDERVKALAENEPERPEAEPLH